MNQSRKIVGIFMALIMSLGVAGCGGSAPTSYDSNPLVGLLEQARSAEVSAEQIEILSGQSITYAQYELALERTFACMTDSGIQVNRNGTVQRSGVTQLDYTFQNAPGTTMSDNERERIYDDCYETNARYVDTYWQAMQPAVVDYSEARAQALRQPLLECLADHGITADSASSFRDLVVANGSLPDGTDCLTDIGYDTWTN